MTNVNSLVNNTRIATSSISLFNTNLRIRKRADDDKNIVRILIKDIKENLQLVTNAFFKQKKKNKKQRKKSSKKQRQ